MDQVPREDAPAHGVDATNAAAPTGRASIRLVTYATEYRWPEDKLARGNEYISALLTSNTAVPNPEGFTDGEIATMRQFAQEMLNEDSYRAAYADYDF